MLNYSAYYDFGETYSVPSPSPILDVKETSPDIIQPDEPQICRIKPVPQLPKPDVYTSKQSIPQPRPVSVSSKPIVSSAKPILPIKPVLSSKPTIPSSKPIPPSSKPTLQPKLRSTSLSRLGMKLAGFELGMKVSGNEFASMFVSIGNGGGHGDARER